MYTYILPDNNNRPIENKSEHQSLILIGANGSGKTRLGVWIEQNNKNVFRICAQKSLKLKPYITCKNYDLSLNQLLYGINYMGTNNKETRYNYNTASQTWEFATSLIDDYESVLSLFMAKYRSEMESYIEDCKKKENLGSSHNPLPEMILDKLKRIWNEIYPHREISIIDDEVVARFKINDKYENYSGSDMSDGERAVLYILALCLSIEKEIIIIDEPELHLHQSIMNKLWFLIEREKTKTFFVYITHDTAFAANHKNSKRVWIKSYDGKNWALETINESSLPNELLLKLLGNRKPVLFIEGTNTSHDNILYNLIFPNYHVVPCGSCLNVIELTKSMRSTEQLHHLDCYGLIDRDFRNDTEISNLKSHNIFTLEVSEIENLFLIKPILKMLANHFNQSDTVVKEVEEYIIKKRFHNDKESQIIKAIQSEIRYQLSILDINCDSIDDFKRAISSGVESIDIDSIYKDKCKLYKTTSYNKILKIYNQKNLWNGIGRFFHMENKSYLNHIVNLLLAKNNDEINKIFKDYIPKGIPINKE